MTHRKTPCNICGSRLLIETNEIIDNNTIYSERCGKCQNLLYGWVRRFEP